MKLWIRGSFNNTLTSVGLGENRELYHNSPDVTSPVITKQKATLVAAYWFAIEDVGDVWNIRLMVVHENFATPTVSIPGNSDDMIRGMYPFSKGPLIYSPKAGISVPPDHKLFMQTVKSVGGTSSTLQGWYNLLFVITGV